MTDATPHSKELVLAAHVLARPDLLPALALDPTKLHNPTVRAVLKVLTAEGPVFAAPGPLIAALQEMPDVTDIQVLEQVFVTQPEPQDVDLASLLGLKAGIEKNHIDRVFLGELEREMAYIQRGSSPEDVADRLERALKRYSGAKIEKDHTARGVLSRIKETPPKTRWRLGVPDIDYAFEGLGPDGKPTRGASAQREVIVLAGQAKAGKTRQLLNWVAALLDQGASVALVVLEDDETAFTTKLMAAKFRIRKHILERYIFGGIGFLGEDGKELAGRCKEAIDWLDGIGSRLRIYDAETRLDIFKFSQALEVMALDKALHDTTHIAVDYIQAWTGDYEAMASYAFGLRAFAGRHNVNLIELSQFSNETIRYGSAYGQLAAKGAGEWGAAAHLGFELTISPELGDKELRLALKIARDAPKLDVYVNVEPSTGAVLRYLGTSEYPEAWGTDKPAAKKGGPRR